MDANVLMKEKDRFKNNDIVSNNKVVRNVNQHAYENKLKPNTKEYWNKVNEIGAGEDIYKETDNKKTKFDVDYLRNTSFLFFENGMSFRQEENSRHLNKYHALASTHEGHALIRRYSNLYTNNSAYKRKKYAKKAADNYEKYNKYMKKLKAEAEDYDVKIDEDPIKECKCIKEIYQKTIKGLEIREEAMLAAAQVKSLSDEDEKFRNIKIKREILRAKLDLTRAYRNGKRKAYGMIESRNRIYYNTDDNYYGPTNTDKFENDLDLDLADEYDAKRAAYMKTEEFKKRQQKVDKEIEMENQKKAKALIDADKKNSELNDFLDKEIKSLTKQLNGTTKEYRKCYKKLFDLKNEQEKRNLNKNSFKAEDDGEQENGQEEVKAEVKKNENGVREINRDDKICKSNLTWAQYLAADKISIKGRKAQNDLAEEVLKLAWDYRDEGIYYFDEKYATIEEVKEAFRDNGFEVFSKWVDFMDLNGLVKLKTK